MKQTYVWCGLCYREQQYTFLEYIGIKKEGNNCKQTHKGTYHIKKIIIKEWT